MKQVRFLAFFVSLFCLKSSSGQEFLKESCLSFHVFQNKFICLVNLRISLGLAQLNPVTQKLELKVKFDPEVGYEKFYWNPENETILMQDYDYEFYFVKNAEAKRLNDVVMANWFGDKEILAVKKVKGQYQIVIVSPENQRVLGSFFSNPFRDEPPYYLEISSDKKTLLLVYVTDIADERVAVIVRNNKATRIESDLAGLFEVRWVNNNTLIASTDKGILAYRIDDKKEKILIKTSSFPALIFSYHQPADLLCVYDPDTKQVYEFDVRSLTPKRRVNLRKYSDVRQIYRDKNCYWIIADEKLYQVGL